MPWASRAVADSGLNAQCLRRDRFLRVNSGSSKRRFEGIWPRCFMHFRLHIGFNLDIRKLYCDCGVSMLIVVPLINFWGLERDL